MGRTASKRTKKGDKISSQRKKTKQKESKKHRREYYSDSSFSNDSSLNSKPSSASLSEYRKTKKSKKPRRHRDDSISSFSDDRSSSPDSKSRKRKRSKTGSNSSKKKVRKMYNSSDSDSDERVTKKKRSTRDSVEPKKKSSKKKLKKHYTSSSNSDSDAQSGGSRSNADGKDRKSKEITPNKKRKVMSPSFSRDDEMSFGDEAVAPVNNSRRLKSVITIVNPNCEEEEEGDKLEKDEHKEEIAYDYDDYPSPRSLESNEGGNDTEADNLSHGTTSNKRMRVEDIESGEIETELGKSASCQKDQEPANSLVKEQDSDKSVPVASVAVLGGDDLESILRQKALENLRKFKVGTAKSIPNKNMNNANDVKEPSSKSVDIVEKKPVKLDSPSTRDVNKRSEFTEVVHKIPEGESVGNKPRMSKETVSHPPKPASLHAVFESKINPGGTDTDASSSSAIEPTSSGKHSSEEKPNEANVSSEYEQKTMSVMRGGEMVQVSYKVYIPKRKPALGRRLLRQ